MVLKLVITKLINQAHHASEALSLRVPVAIVRVVGAMGVLGGSRGAIASRVGPLAAGWSLVGGCGMCRNARELMLRWKGRHIGVGLRRGRVLRLQRLIVLALHLLSLPLLLCKPLLGLGLEERVEGGLDVLPPKKADD